jgi:hypothetical protein
MTHWAESVFDKWTLEHRKKVSYLSAIIQFAHAIGGVDQWRVDEEVKLKVLRAIYQSCLIINGGPDLKSKTRVFYWLAVWMNHHRLLANPISAEDLWKHAWNSFVD